MKRAAQQRILSTPLRLTTAVAAAIVFAALTVPPAQAQTFSVLYNFTGGADGEFPYAGVTVGVQRFTAGSPIAHSSGIASSKGELR